MKARIVQIGNSRGIRLPKAVLDHAGLTEEVDIEATPNQIIIRSARAPREGWDEAFRLMAERGDDALADDTTGRSTFDESEWEW
jgi:antitoxin MazE